MPLRHALIALTLLTGPAAGYSAPTDADRSFLMDEVTRINSADESSFAKEAKNTSDPQIKAYVPKFASMDAKHEQMGEALK